MRICWQDFRWITILWWSFVKPILKGACFLFLGFDITTFYSLPYFAKERSLRPRNARIWKIAGSRIEDALDDQRDLFREDEKGRRRSALHRKEFRHSESGINLWKYIGIWFYEIIFALVHRNFFWENVEFSGRNGSRNSHGDGRSRCCCLIFEIRN